MSIKYLDAKRLRRVLIGGGNWLKNHENYLNELNVYPVPDGDTGTNMSKTIDNMIKDIENLTDRKTDMKHLSEVVEDALLMGARGNSGTIFSQIITGFLKGIDGKRKLLPQDIYIALKSAKDMAYKAVETPVEGTILTVIREVSEKAEELSKETEYLDVMIKELVDTAKLSVEKTPELLDKLKEAGVVDSGAMGLFYFLEGIYKTITEIDILNNINNQEREFNKKISNFSHNIENINFQYCTEFVIRTQKEDADIEVLKEELLKQGDSAVFAKTSKKFKTHIHTNTPDIVINLAMQNGEIENVKVENMIIQNEEMLGASVSNIYINSNKVHTKMAYIVVADTEELKDKFLKMGASVVILGGQGKNPSVQDFFDAINKITDDKQIVILPNNKNIISTAKLAVDRIEQQNIILQETKTMLEGYFYLTYYDESLDKLSKEFEVHKSIEITQAVRKTRVNGLDIDENDYMGIVNNKIEFVNKDILKLYRDIESKYITENTLNVTVVEGVKKDNRLDPLFEVVKQDIYGFLEIIKSSQEDYNYYILIENRQPNLKEVGVVTDSSSDLEIEDIKNYPICVVPLKIEIDGISYLENIDLNKSEMWDKIKKGSEFKTSQPSPKSLINAYNRLIRKGYKKIYSIHLSRGMSGTVQTANLAKETCKYPSIVEVIDSQTGGLHLGFLALEVAKRGNELMSVDKINEFIIKYKEKSKIFMYINDLSGIAKAGRINETVKTFGNILNLKPIVTMQNGYAVIYKKAFGNANAIKFLEKTIIEESKKNSIYLTGSWGGDITMRDDIMKLFDSMKNQPKVNVLYRDTLVSTAVGAHAGSMFAIVLIPRLL